MNRYLETARARIVLQLMQVSDGNNGASEPNFERGLEPFDLVKLLMVDFDFKMNSSVIFVCSSRLY